MPGASENEAWAVCGTLQTPLETPQGASSWPQDDSKTLSYDPKTLPKRDLHAPRPVLHALGSSQTPPRAPQRALQGLKNLEKIMKDSISSSKSVPLKSLTYGTDF